MGANAMSSNPPTSVYVGYINSDLTEGRGSMKPAVLGLDFAAVDEQTKRRAGYTGHGVRQLEVDGDANTRVAGYWTDELGAPHCGPLPVTEPSRWPDDKVKDFEALAKKFPDTPRPDLTDRPLLVGTLDRPRVSYHGASWVYLLVVQTTQRIGDYTYPWVRLYNAHSTKDAAVERAALLRADTNRHLGAKDRLHVLEVSVDADVGQRWTALDLDDPALGMRPRPKVGETGWLGWDEKVATTSRDNTRVSLVWSESDHERDPQDPDLARYDALLAELRGGTVA